MSRSRRGTYIWLLMLGLAVGIVLLAGALEAAISAEVALALVIGYIVLAGASLATIALPSLNVSMPQISSAIRMSPNARQASQRARTRPGFSRDATLTDVGTIINERRRDGQWDRHLAQVISLDDDAVQPFISVFVDSNHSNRLAIVQFDIYDQTGRQRFSRQCEQWVRDGNNLIVCDRQLPLQQLSDVHSRTGTWDLRITVDGSVVGIHSFTVTPSTADRRRQFGNEGETEMAEIVDDMPVSLEDLLRERSQTGSASRR